MTLEQIISDSRAETLERMIDQSGLHTVLESIAKICHEKADHLRCNWQDDFASKNWHFAGHAVDGAAVRIERRKI